MAQIFISYSRSDRPAIEKLSDALEAAGHAVWWDRHIRGGAAFAKDIEAQLQKADAIIVAWSSDSKESDWVKDEAVFARDKGILIPINLSGGDAPLGFRQYQIIDFLKWKGDPKDEPVQSLLSAIADLTGGEAPEKVEPAPPTLIDKLKINPALTAGIIGGVMMLAIAGFLLMRETSQEEPAEQVAAAGRLPAPSEVSIGVLPFTDMSPEGNQEYFADGLSEELLNVLVRIEGLKVASRTSSFALKNEILNIGDIAKRLKVNYVLEGSVRKMDNRIRITAQLIDARDDRHLWSDTYDRHLSDIFRIQDEIATAVVGELRDELGMAANAPVVIKPATENMSAYDMYLRAREKFIARGTANVRESLQLFEQVVDMDPGFARGWEGLAAVYAIATSWGILDRDYSALSLVAAKKALDLDPELSMPYAVMGLTYRTHYPTPWAESIQNLQNAIERDDKNSNAWLWLGMNYMATGDADAAIDAFNNCMEIDEAARLCRKYRSISNLFLGNVDEAMADAEENAKIGYFGDFDVYISTFLQRNDIITAYTVSRNVYWWGGFPHSDYIDALINPDNQPADRLSTFEKWGEANKVTVYGRTNVMLAIRAYDKIDVETFDNDYEDLWLPQFAHFRKSEDFIRLTEALGLADYWREVGFPSRCRELPEDKFECD
ncbi:MAG: TIR domain-containing protein [Marinicaulis sp.]|nr:TIR domain-containing protein [Marinicaulis sp.]NNE41329.1 TIR domain-containing protein [Marinicaulis sp.]NNL87653.1 TIR domain-containing protein [Marinicaulis sp.]